MLGRAVKEHDTKGILRSHASKDAHRRWRLTRGGSLEGLAAPRSAGTGQGRLQPRVDGLALEREDAEDALVDAVEGFLLDEAMQGFDAERELAEGE